MEISTGAKEALVMKKRSLVVRAWMKSREGWTDCQATDSRKRWGVTDKFTTVTVGRFYRCPPM